MCHNLALTVLYGPEYVSCVCQNLALTVLYVPESGLDCLIRAMFARRRHAKLVKTDEPVVLVADIEAEVPPDLDCLVLAKIWP